MGKFVEGSNYIVEVMLPAGRKISTRTFKNQKQLELCGRSLTKRGKYIVHIYEANHRGTNFWNFGI